MVLAKMTQHIFCVKNDEDIYREIVFGQSRELVSSPVEVDGVPFVLAKTKLVAVEIEVACDAPTKTGTGTDVQNRPQVGK